MSLPLSRRIAQAALLVAAGASPLLAAGSASAMDLVPQGDLASGITQADAPDPAATVQGTAHELGQSTGATAASTVATGVPATADATGHTVAAALPSVDKTLGGVTAPAAKTAATTGMLANIATTVAPRVVDRAGPALTSKLAPVAGQQRSATTNNPLGGLTGALPTAGLTQSLPTGPLASGLPTKSLPGGDALGSLTGAHSDEHRLGGLPALGGGSPLDSVTHLLGGVGAAGLPHLPGVGG
ncbi:hypothetical protein CFP65_4801 [Kitasatospora sp. MMS16-BH015]|uniref:hypothetical protein n=1 Tax=Kitasatospora sp. MMS16-BH015 TaxID=2018025 RepID=UPI000CA17655|nr:hypothetical protein CFP65_4801 [Kitasatospora sp. MMS16-BH015]